VALLCLVRDGSSSCSVCIVIPGVQMAAVAVATAAAAACHNPCLSVVFLTAPRPLLLQVSGLGS
jgi:hypothetical protein